MTRFGQFVRDRGASLGLTVAVTIWVFPAMIYDVGDWIDPSWSVALQMAAQRRMAFGRAIAFTYGPLGLLTSSAMAVPRYGLASAWVRVFLFAAIAWFVVTRLSKVVHPVIAAAVAVPLVWAITPANSTDPLVILYLVIGLAVAALDDGAEVHWRHEAAVAVAVGLTVVWKFDVGVEIVAVSMLFLVAQTLLGRQQWRTALLRAGRGIGISIATSVLVWAIVGQPMAAIGSYIRYSTSSLFGFGAMTATNSALWFAMAAALAAFGVIALAIERWGGATSKRIIVIKIGFVVLALYLIAKQSWTRSDPGHVSRFAALVMIVATALVARRTLAQYLLTAGLAFVMVVGSVSHVPILQPGSSWRAAQRFWTMTVSSKARADRVAWGHQALPSTMTVPPTMIERVRGHTVHIEPFNTSVVWAYQLRWDPVPVFQSYAAYTDALDRLNARELDSATGPEFILAEPGSIDARVPRFESPAAVLSELCHYRLIETSTRWHLLQRRTTRACGTTRSLGSSSAKTITVPSGRPDEIVIARVHIGGDGWRGLVLRPRPVHVQLSPNGPQQRFVVGTATGPHVLVLPTCLSGDARSPGRLASFDTNPYGPLTFDRRARVEFEAIAYDCSAE